MDFFYRFDINFFSAIMLFVIYITMKIRRDAMSTSNRLLCRLIWVNIFLLLIEVFSWVYEGKPGEINWYLNYIINAVFAWSTPLISCAWAAYIDFHLYNSVKRLRRRWFYLQPMFISTVFIIINHFTPILFRINSDNTYERGQYIWLIIGLNVAVYVYSWLLIYKNRKNRDSELITVMMIYLIMPVLATVIQYCCFGVSIIWSTMAMTITVSYIFLENTSKSKDYLTGLVNRSRTDDYIEYLIENNKPFAVIMMDIDDFKQINDQYGHVSGDLALKIFAKTLRKVFKKAKVIGRYAGDEFIVISDEMNARDFKQITNSLRTELERERRVEKVSFKIGFSIGYQNWTSEENYNYETLINLTDQQMYGDKKLKNTRR